jgi:hypothetical protein
VPDRATFAQRARMAYLRGVETQSLRVRGRGLTLAELVRVVDQYPGDPDGAFFAWPTITDPLQPGHRRRRLPWL